MNAELLCSKPQTNEINCTLNSINGTDTVVVRFSSAGGVQKYL